MKYLRKTRKKRAYQKKTKKNMKKVGGSFLDQNTYLYVILGLGCSNLTKKFIDSMKRGYSLYTNIDMNNIEILCRTNSSALYSISKSYCNIVPMKNSSYINELTSKIEEKAKIYKKVLISGHSYGGAIANRIAEKLNILETSNNYSNICISAFGSIYVSPTNLVDKINIVNYMSLGDVALTCNKKLQQDLLIYNVNSLENTFEVLNKKICKYKKINKSLFIICPYEYKANGEVTLLCENTPTENISIFGNNEWYIHNSYKLLNLLLVTHSNNIETFNSDVSENNTRNQIINTYSDYLL